MRTVQSHTDADRAAAMAAGLRDLAAMVADHPQVARDLGAFSRVSVYIGPGNVRDRLVTLARAALAFGASVTEHHDCTWAGVNVAFGPVRLHVYAEVTNVHDVTRIVEYTPRPILGEITHAEASQTGAVA